jgi:hypothetical protein
MELACTHAALARAHSEARRRATPGSRMNVVKHRALQALFQRLNMDARVETFVARLGL